MAYRAQRINVDEPPRRSPVADKQPEPKSPKSPARPAFSRHASASKVPIVLETRPESVNQVRYRLQSKFDHCAIIVLFEFAFILLLTMYSIGKIYHRHGHISADTGAG